jgi:AcrR family transcriptional regulator
LTIDETPERIKRAARRLFAQRGIDGVSVRDIVTAAGQKNNGSLHYYFRSKDALVQELVREGAVLIENRRRALLDALEAVGGPKNVREIIEILVWPATNLENDQGEDTYTRFITIRPWRNAGTLLISVALRTSAGCCRSFPNQS